MKITNKHNLPELIVAAITGDIRQRPEGRYSATELTNPPPMVALRRYYHDRIVADAADYLWRLYGSNLHLIIEQGAKHPGIAKQALPELYLSHQIDDNTTITGIADLLIEDDEGRWHLWDWKSTSVWAAKNLAQGSKPEWDQQLNVLAWLARRNGQKVDTLRIAMILRDWSAGAARREGDPYPPIPFREVGIQMWRDEETTEWIMGRIVEIRDAQDALESGKELPRVCTPEERWAKPDIWAVRRKGLKRAVSGGLHQDENKAHAHAAVLTEKTGKAHEVDFRPGESTRCLMCDVAQFCPLGREIVQGREA